MEGRYASEGFRQWVSLNFDEYTDEDNKKMRWGRALVAKHYYDEKKYGIKIQTKLWCFGYDADSANVKCWYESLMPIFQVSQGNIDDVKSSATEALQLAYQLADSLRFSLIRAWFRPQVDGNQKEKWTHIIKFINKAGYLSTYKKIEYEYWEYLEKHFLMMIYELIDLEKTAGKPMSIYQNWVKEIRQYCLKYFDQHALNEVTDGTDMKRAIKARNYLWNELYPQRKSLLKDINEFKG